MLHPQATISNGNRVRVAKVLFCQHQPRAVRPHPKRGEERRREEHLTKPVCRREKKRVVFLFFVTVEITSVDYRQSGRFDKGRLPFRTIFTNLTSSQSTSSFHYALLPVVLIQPSRTNHRVASRPSCQRRASQVLQSQSRAWASDSPGASPPGHRRRRRNHHPTSHS